MKKLLTGVAAIALSCVTLTAYAGPINSSFETGLTGWSSLGFTSTVSGLGAYTPTDGGSAAFLSTSNDDDAVSKATIESTLGLSSGSLDALTTNPPATEGSLIYQSFYATAGQDISFDYLFVTDEEPGQVDDFAFVSILVDGVLAAIASVDGTTLIDPSSIAHGEGGAIWGSAGSDYITSGLQDSGWLSFSHTLGVSGLVTLGIGVMDGGDSVVESGLMVDNVKPVPEPAALILLSFGLLGLAMRQRRFA